MESGQGDGRCFPSFSRTGLGDDIDEFGMLSAELDQQTRDEADDEEAGQTLPGFRFHPTDEELVGFYLRRKVEGKPLRIELIKEMDIYKHEPWELPKASGSVGNKEWYFFCIRGRKYRNGIRPNRTVTGSGFWKATGIDRSINCNASANADAPTGSSAGSLCIGLKKSLVYYRGIAGKGTKTDWMMHEFRLPSGPSESTQEVEAWTLCRIFQRDSYQKKYLRILQESTSLDSEVPEQQQSWQQAPVSESSSKSSNNAESNIANRGYCSTTNHHSVDGITTPNGAPHDSNIHVYGHLQQQYSPLSSGENSAIDTFWDGNWDAFDQVMGFTTNQEFGNAHHF